MRTIWVYKGTPNPPVKPSAVLNRGIVFSFLGLDVNGVLNGKDRVADGLSLDRTHSLFEPRGLRLPITAESG